MIRVVERETDMTETVKSDLSDLYSLQAKLFKLGMMPTTSKTASDMIYDCLDLVDQQIKKAKKNG